MRLRSLRLFVLTAALALLTACTLTQFTYNRLDLIARWRVGQYVTLNDVQRQTFNAGFDAFGFYPVFTDGLVRAENF